MRRGHACLVLLALMFLATNAWAQGFGVYEQSACTVARGGAAVAAPCEDGSAIFYNPAGLGFATGTQISFGGTLINPRGGFTSDAGIKGDLLQRYYQVPSIYLVQPFKRVAVGFGLYAPYGLTTEWPLNFEGRFLGYKTSIKGLYLQPTVAFKLSDRIAIGGGLDLTYAALELNQRVDLSSQFLNATTTFAQIGVPVGTDFANVTVSGHRWGVGYNLGMQAKATDTVSLGVRYLSRQTFDVNDGHFTPYQIPTNLLLPLTLGPTLPKGTPIDLMVRGLFTGQNALASQTASTSITYPDQLVVGTAVKVTRKTTVLADYTFVHWSLFDTISITRQYVSAPIVMNENYKDTHGVRLGVEHQINPRLVARGGFVAHTAAAPDETVTPLLPEAPRKLFSGGLGFGLVRNLHADLYYTYLLQSDRRGRTVAATNNGTYNFMSNLFGITFSLRY